MITQRLIDTVQGYWNEREARERRLLAFGAIALLLALIYLFGIAPAASGASRLRRDLPELREQALSLQAMAREAQSLSTGASQPASLTTQEGVEAALTRKGIKPQSVVVTGELVRVQLNNASFAGVLDWVDEMQKVARLSVVETSFTAQAQTDIVNATVSLRQPKIDDRQ